MFIDSHCHLDRIDLQPYQNEFANFVAEARRQHIKHMLCIAIRLEAYPAMVELVADYPDISLSVGVHPNEQDCHEPTIQELLDLAQHEKVVAIGETGLDYFRTEGEQDWQHTRFRTHIRAAKLIGKPLIIHTREAKHDTLKILQEEGADQIGGVIHCFTEDWEFAQQAMALNFYISFSGIVTFNNAKAIQEVAQKIPDELFLIETDSPYLAPVPCRGKPNYPTYVAHVAAKIAQLRGTSIERIAAQSSENYYRLFG